LEIVTTRQNRRRVQVGGALLEPTNERRMIIFRSMAFEDGARNMEQVSRIVAQLSTRVSTPLSIVGLGLQEIGSMIAAETSKAGSSLFQRTAKAVLQGSDTIAEVVPGLIQKLNRQLLRVENAFGELQTYEPQKAASAPPAKISAKAVLQEVLGEFPESGAGRLDMDLPDGETSVYADTFQLAFMIEAITAHLMKVTVPDSRIDVTLKEEGKQFRFSFTGSLSQETASSESRKLKHARVLAFFSITEQTIRQFARQHGGEYWKDDSVPGVTKLGFTISG
jgi:signal transduction histidine kinase